MLFLALKDNGKIVIDCQEGIDPNMRVADLFRDGPMILKIKKVKGKNNILVGIDAPQELRVLRGEQITSCDSA